MYYGISGLKSLVQRHQAETVVRSRRPGRRAENPYERLDRQLNNRINSIKNWAVNCEQLAQGLARIGAGSDPDQRITPAVRGAILDKFNVMLNGDAYKNVESATNRAVWTSAFVQLGANDPAVIAGKNLLLSCYDEGLKVTLRNTISNFEREFDRMSAGWKCSMGEVRSMMQGLRSSVATITKNYVHNCDPSNRTGYNNALTDARINWEQRKATALREAEVAEAAAARAEADRLAAEAEADRLAAEAEAAAAAADLAAAEELKRQQAQAEADAEAARQAEVEAEMDAAEAEEKVDQMQQVEEGADAADAAESEFPWLWVAVGGAAALGVAGLIYFTSK